ncbi:MAG: DinB family protein [Acidobacteriota bacterium]
MAEIFLAEFEAQAPVTRRFLERLPEDKLTWKPHAKSMTAGQLAFHLATVPGGVVHLLQGESAAPPDFSVRPQPGSCGEVLRALDESVATVRTLLPKMDDGRMRGIFRFVAGEQEIMALPREAFLRNIMLNHWYQHRGQFSVYLRLLGIAVPASWGPSADEAPVFARQAGAGVAR